MEAITVAELIEWLKTQDQGATVEVLRRVPSWDYGTDTFEKVDFNPEETADYTDFRRNQFAKGQSYENDRTLFLGDDGL